MMVASTPKNFHSNYDTQAEITKALQNLVREDFAPDTAHLSQLGVDDFAFFVPAALHSHLEESRCDLATFSSHPAGTLAFGSQLVLLG